MLLSLIELERNTSEQIIAITTDLFNVRWAIAYNNVVEEKGISLIIKKCKRSKHTQKLKLNEKTNALWKTKL